MLNHQTAVTAREYAANLPSDYSLAVDGYDPEYMESPYQPVDSELMTVEARQALNIFMAEYWEV